MKFCIILCCIACAIFYANAGIPRNRRSENVKQSSENSYKILFALLENYNQQARPYEGEAALQVTVSIYLRHLSRFSEVDMEFTADCNFRMGWHDPRLQFNQNISLPFLHIEHDVSGKIWMPDLFFGNEISSFVHSATVVNELVKLYPNGHVEKSIRYTITLACPMQLQYFPMDTQFCPIYIESYAYSTSEMQLKWSGDGATTTRVKNSFLNFQVQETRTHEFNEVRKGETIYPCLVVGIRLRRSMTYYVIQMYLPSGLLVVVSWFSLWMDQKFIAERVALGVTTVLTITTLLSAVNATSPKIPYIKATDVFMGICFSFVFVALLETVLVSGLHRRRNKLGMQTPRRLPVGAITSRAQTRPYGNNVEKNWPQEQRCIEADGDADEVVLSMVDRMARIFFPLTFFGVNVIYWVFYIHSSRLYSPDWDTISPQCLQYV